jgi:hypothetical protein
MAVIPFPGRTRQRVSAEPQELAYCVVAALRALGEPATVGEILQFLGRASQIGPEAPEEQLAAILDAYSRTGFPGMDHTPVFRCVTLHGGLAWAFTQAFRTTLHRVGLPSGLRAPG